MTFVEAAIAVLEDAGEPLSVDELTKRVVHRDLLGKAGADPLRSMKGRLTSELKKGADSRVAQGEDGTWTLAGAASAGKARSARAQKTTKAKTATKAATAGKSGKSTKASGKTTKASSKSTKASGKTTKASDKSTAKASKVAKAKVAGEAADEAKAAPPKSSKSKGGGKKTVKAAAEKADGQVEAGEAKPRKTPARKRTPKAAAEEAPEVLPAPEPELTEEERELAAVLGDEARSTAAVADLTEYRDRSTEDEDREMVPEMVSDRRGGRDRMRGRRDRKKRRDRSQDRVQERGQDRKVERSEGAAVRGADTGNGKVREVPQRREASMPPEAAAEAAPFDMIADAASVLRAMLPQSRAVPIHQLAQMMRKRRMLADSPDGSVALLRAALRFGELWCERRGLRPSIVHVGRDRFSLTDVSDSGALGAAEERVRAALAQLEDSTRASLAGAVRDIDVPALERLVQIYLETSGFSDIRWIKRAGKSGYAQAIGPNGPVLIGARVGPEPVDRRGIGELRVGVAAKNLTSGLLLSPAELSDEATAEWKKGGSPVAIVCGQAFIDALVSAGVGVRWMQAPLPYLDGELLRALAI